MPEWGLLTAAYLAPRLHAHLLTMDTRTATVNNHPAHECRPAEQPEIAKAPVLTERLLVQILRLFVAAL